MPPALCRSWSATSMKAAEFYESVFDLKRVGQETLDLGSAVYLSDGVINLVRLQL